MEFARFLGLPPIRTGWNTTDIADAVCSGLFTGVRGKQIAGRCVLASTGP